MKNKKIVFKTLLSLFLVLVVAYSIYNLYVNVFRVLPLDKNSDSETGLTTIIYNGKTYYEQGDLSEYPHIVNENNIPRTINDLEPYFLLNNDKRDLSEYLNLLTNLKKYQHYWIEPNRYFIYNTDIKESPLLIFEKNSSALGPSDGWYYFSEDFQFNNMPTIYNSQVKSVVLQDFQNQNILVEIKDGTDEIIQCIKDRKNICTLFPNIDNKVGYLVFVQFWDYPLSLEIGLKREQSNVFYYRTAEGWKPYEK